MPPPQPQMMVGAWFAPTAVRMRVLYASFWNVVPWIWSLGLAWLNRLSALVRTPSDGCPERYQ